MGTRRKQGAKKTTKRSAKKAAKPKRAAKKPTRKTSKKASKKTPKKTPKKPSKRTSKKPAKRTAKKPSKRASKKTNTDAKATAVGTKAPRLKKPPAKTRPEVAEPPKKRTKSATKKARSKAKTVPGGSTPPMDDVTLAKRALRDLRETLARVSDADAEMILGDGALERLIGAIVPAAKSGANPHEHLATHKRRASLLARLRHGVNERSAHRHDDVFVSPTRVQWFYDGLTFLEGTAPYEGVVGLYRDGVVRYGLNVVDAERDQGLGPLEADFVSVTEARKAFRGSKPADGLASMIELLSGDDPDGWITWLSANPWAIGAQHSSVERVSHGDAALPKVVAKRSTDSAHDVLLVASPQTAIVGKTGRVLSSFRELWMQAEQQRTFVQRQSGFLKRELGWKIRDPRFIVMAGSTLTSAERNAVRDELEKHHASIRLVTFGELEALARATHAFFESRI